MRVFSLRRRPIVSPVGRLVAAAMHAVGPLKLYSLLLLLLLLLFSS